MNRTKLVERASRIQVLCGEINEREAELARLMTRTMTRTVTRRASAPATKPLRWQQTPEGRAALSKAQKKRWQKVHAANGNN